MPSKERFEAWKRKYIAARGLIPVAWEGWQAGEYYALEEAAKMAELKAGDCHTLGSAEEFRELAARIRLMMENK